MIYGYDNGTNGLTDFEGRTILGARRYQAQTTLRDWEGDPIYPVAFRLPARNGYEQFIVGHSQGQGMLFRGGLLQLPKMKYGHVNYHEAIGQAIEVCCRLSDADRELSQQLEEAIDNQGASS